MVKLINKTQSTKDGKTTYKLEIEFNNGWRDWLEVDRETFFSEEY